MEPNFICDLAQRNRLGETDFKQLVGKWKPLSSSGGLADSDWTRAKGTRVTGRPSIPTGMRQILPPRPRHTAAQSSLNHEPNECFSDDLSRLARKSSTSRSLRQNR